MNHTDAQNKAIHSKMRNKTSNATRSYPIKGEVHELRKYRGSATAEKELGSYRKMREYSKASGTWGKKNSSQD